MLEHVPVGPSLRIQVNLKMCFEGMEENGSVNLDKFIESEKNGFFAGADCMCISGKLLAALLTVDR